LRLVENFFNHQIEILKSSRSKNIKSISDFHPQQERMKYYNFEKKNFNEDEVFKRKPKIPDVISEEPLKILGNTEKLPKVFNKRSSLESFNPKSPQPIKGVVFAQSTKSKISEFPNNDTQQHKRNVTEPSMNLFFGKSESQKALTKDESPTPYRTNREDQEGSSIEGEYFESLILNKKQIRKILHPQISKDCLTEESYWVYIFNNKLNLLQFFLKK
jgi:hypothetical protein